MEITQKAEPAADATPWTRRVGREAIAATASRCVGGGRGEVFTGISRISEDPDWCDVKNREDRMGIDGMRFHLEIPLDPPSFLTKHLSTNHGSMGVS